MNEAPITHSPHTFVPKREMSREEEEELYRTRLDETYRSYTVIDVIKKVYHRSFSDDLLQYIGQFPEKFTKTNDKWKVSRCWVNQLSVIHTESIFGQPIEDVVVDIVADARIKVEEVLSRNPNVINRYNIKPQLRLRYSFDLRPCEMACHFVGVVLDEKESLLNIYKGGIPMDKWFLPVLKTDDDYRHLARWILYHYDLKNADKDVPFEPMEWLKAMGTEVKQSNFPEDVYGEFFFGFGIADTVDEKGNVHKNDKINAGTVIVSHSFQSEGIKNTTLTHEGVHKYLGIYYLLLQKLHGHEYCSYLCKRKSIDSTPGDRWRAIDIMELQANKLPGFLMIPDECGRKHAEMLLASYGGGRTIENMRRLVRDMADYYKTTKTVAKTRLLNFGYSEVRGMGQSANGRLVPSYVSTLQKDETYTIDERDGVREYVRNKEFRNVIDSGKYVYAEGHYCRNEKKYICYDQFGATHLTFYARTHMGECCLVFKSVYENTFSRITNGILQKGVGRGRKNIVYRHKDGASAVTEEGKIQRAQILREAAVTYGTKMNFPDMVCHYMKMRKLSKGDLADRTGLSEETIQNMRNRSDVVFSIQAVVAVAIALKLPPNASIEFVRCSPAKFLSTDEMHVYQYALQNWYMLPVQIVNRRLVEMEIPPLTNYVEGYDENGFLLDEKEEKKTAW